MFSAELLAQLAKELDASKRSRVQIEHFSKRFPGMTVEDGYRVSREWVRMQRAEGAQVIGHKIGLTSRAMQMASQIDEPDYGTLLDSMARQLLPSAAVATHSCGGSAPIVISPPSSIRASM